MDEYIGFVARGHFGVERHRLQDVDDGQPLPVLGGAALPGSKRAVSNGQSGRSRNNMMKFFTSLPLEKLGMRPALITLTYPGDWRRWVPDAATFEKHRKSWGERFERYWKEPLIGPWAKEFQPRTEQPVERQLAPHLHAYVRLPEAVTDLEYAGLRARQRKARDLIAQYGHRRGKYLQPVIGWGRNGENYGGDFGLWLRDMWTEVVGTFGIDPKHHGRGVDVRVAFYNEGAARAMDRDLLSTYLAKESGKWQQKRRPENFPGRMRWFGSWGETEGFYPSRTEFTFEDPAVGRVVADVLARLQRARNVKRYGPMPKELDHRRPGDGGWAMGPDAPADMRRLVRFAEREVDKARERRERSERRRNFSGE